MLKRSTILALGFAALAAPWWSAPGMAAMVNSLAANALASNALIPNGVTSNFVPLQAVRLALPDGSELTFRWGGHVMRPPVGLLLALVAAPLCPATGQGTAGAPS